MGVKVTSLGEGESAPLLVAYQPKENWGPSTHAEVPCQHVGILSPFGASVLSPQDAKARCL